MQTPVGSQATWNGAVLILVGPEKVVLAVSGSERINKSLIVHNTSSADADIKVYWEDFEYKSPYDSAKSFIPAGTSKSSINDWVSFSPQGFKIPASGTQKIEYSINIPDQLLTPPLSTNCTSF